MWIMKNKIFELLNIQRFFYSKLNKFKNYFTKCEKYDIIFASLYKSPKINEINKIKLKEKKYARFRKFDFIRA